ncbi:glycosyltransferase family 4 protein [Clostridium thermarum]|uniref:glycosyltransferase family 4 protein n=1 Tax=Clostridium thermarum TaxID=1716543 RepID=UPI0013D55D2D|nr:glycosyltransferase family 4 protein [Clostridium thermarum]
MKYYVLFPEAQNLHLIKDVGMLAYKMTQLFSAESYLACYNNDDYKYLESHVRGLKVDFIKKKFNNDLVDGIAYLKRRCKEIDCLQLFHVTLRSVVYGTVYKGLNPTGKLFLKLDCTDKLLSKIRGLKGLKKKLFHSFFDKVDVIGVEQERLFNEIKELLPMFLDKFLYLPNGIDYRNSDYENIDFNDKENYILQVGRLGATEKNTELLVEAFNRAYEQFKDNWKLLLVGEYTEGFRKYIDDFMLKHPAMKDKIDLTGAIYDRERLQSIYRRTKIFCLTSLYESFGLVLIEAAASGNVIISTDVGVAREVIVNGGIVVESPEVQSFSEALVRMANSDLKEICYNNIKMIKERYNWDIVAAKLFDKLMSGGGYNE